MARYTITPWRHHSDLLKVRQQLYGRSKDGQDHRRHAVNRVLAWKLRGSLPHAIESTALLIDAILHHASSASNSPFSIRAVYTAAFTRFVTGFCDIGRNKERSLEPSSMLDIAKQIGMPVEFVALRHEATHEEMPGIGRLVKVTERALKWLWEVYWSKLPEDESAEIVAASLASLKDEARRLLKEFRMTHREALRAKQSVVAQDSVSRTSEVCRSLCGNSNAKMSAFVEVLIQDRLLSPSKRKLGALMDGAFLIWDPLLKDIARKQRRFIPCLVTGILEAVGASSSAPAARDVDKEALSQWLIQIDFDENWMASRSDHEQHDLEVEIWKWCTLHANHWTSWLGQKLEQHNDAQIPGEWAELLQASRLGYEEAGEDNAEDLADPDVDARGALSAVGNASQSVPSPWSRVAIPISTPIGVVL
ncbi:Pre-rRNA-processing protein las1 [Fulvia fulva]|uniref:Pre-rRNA-processing protein las1 n=1 Tax=Passalora fulva TaxID=5499 RepID=A0A9Q8LAV5_PASFU|nr:Pre-rRNA-processing protein las1 [Fulvia fulva]KAK4630839.1 Pre-rRNA-processing protein las1 [Fulvia fulva]KAK4632928.1 Pre-rRNA-processing protein las1 [Fulvia fulva]UJO14105.1 Pre-rRNA-processing protein las1 [Fulvia fulva]WPV11638.1 Pre-rRNA-processing protein las1 [Fulvia fulva]WPV26586.1 Pre-rRNA-processing protein las1 [Fulvia fulva]